jgi:porphobilinogen synthase
MADFPMVRLRRLRRTPMLRRMVRETSLSVDDFILPLFVEEGKNIRKEIDAMPGVYRFSPDKLAPEIKEIAGLGIPGVILFGIPAAKDETGSSALEPDGVVPQAIKTIKDAAPELVVATDVCLCEYTSHGHCGVIENGCVVNDATLPLLGEMAAVHAAAGADVIAPSDMMDGRIGVVRAKLDQSGFQDVPVMAYAAKYASAFYGPFREAAGSAPQFGDRRSYQMDPANAREALREVAADIAEGADMVMVKPAMAYLDIIRRVRETYDHPLAAYNVSGEYSMIKAAAMQGWIDERRVALELLTAIKRAGADLILTYHARDAARWLSEKE